MFQNLSTRSTPEHQVQDVFDCKGDDSSGVNKEGEVMISGKQFGGADYTNVTSSVASVSNSCPDVLEKSLIGKCITNGSSDDHAPVEEGDNNSMRVHSSEAILRGKGLCDELDFNSPIASVQNHHSQNQNELHGDESEELVDVRVCDVCGDVGREMLLALCCKCGDGAEHIYCMNPAMDKVPESDWVCEECLLVQEPKRHQLAVIERSESSKDEDPEPSCSIKRSQGSLRIYTVVKQVGKRRKIHLSKSSGLSNKKMEMDTSIKTKKRTIDQRAQALKISGSGRQTRMTQVSSLKNTEKKKDSADQVSSFVDLPAKKVEQAGSSCHSSLKPEQQFCGGSLNSLEVQCSWDDIHQSSSKENPAGKLKKKHPDKKVSKSLSCAGVGPIPLDMSNTQSSTPTIEGIQCESGNNTEKRSKENKASQVRQTRVVSKIVKRANIFGKNVKDKMNGNTSVKPLGSIANKRKNYTYTSGAGSVENKKLHSHLSCVVNSSDVNGDSDQRVSLSPQKVKIDGSDHSLTSYKILPIDSQDLKVMPTLDPANVDYTDLSAISVVPESKCIWKGMFKLDKSGKLSSDCYGVQAHLSTRASPKVDELIIKFSSELQLREVPRVLTWPIQFQKNQPTEQDIALYFFAQDFLSYQRSYWKLLEVMTSNDLALEANFGGFRLLVFPSRLLPEKSQRWNSLPYLWGVFRARKLDDFHFPNLNISPLNQRLGTPVTCGSESKLFSPSVHGSAFASHISLTTMEGTEFVDPVVLQSSASMKFRGQSSEHEVPSLPEPILKEHHVQAGTVFCDGWRFEGFYRGVLSDELQEGRRFYDENVKSVSNVDIFRCGKSMTPVGLCSDVVSSSSLDSGPSGLSDSGWCAKSANEEPFENLGSYNNDLNLDLCLGNRSEDVNLDLALGFPSQSAYQPEDYLKNRNNQNEEISLVLSLGMPCC